MTLLISLLVGGLFGAWASSMIGVSVPNTRLRAFSDDVAAGRVLLMLDVPPGRVEEVRSLVQRRHPECDRGMEPAIPAFP
jgi:hypothetical protein